MSEQENELNPDTAALTPEPQHAAPPDPEDEESDIDGCSEDFRKAEPTPDDELPMTEGGVL